MEQNFQAVSQLLVVGHIDKVGRRIHVAPPEVGQHLQRLAMRQGLLLDRVVPHALV